MRTYFAVRLNNLYIRQPYHYHITNNSSKIINHLTQEINLITVGCNNLLIFITELAVILGLIFFFVIYQPFIMLTLLIVMLPSIYIFRKVKKLVSKLSKLRQIQDRKSIFLITQTFSGIKDLLIFNKSKIFSDQYIKVFKIKLLVVKFIHSTSKKYFRIFLIIGIATISIYLPMEDDNYKNELLKLMAAFAIASFRIMPALLE